MKPYYKQIFYCWLLAIGYLLCTSSSCKKDEEPSTPETELAKLPPETQEGKNTIGCLVNGRAFLPKGNFSAGGNATQCFYQNTDGEYTFLVGFTDLKRSDGVYGLNVLTNKRQIVQGESYPLIRNSAGNATARYFIISNGRDNIFETNETCTGQLFIKKMDDNKQIVSGTFSFDAINDRGEKVEIRHGRFDMQFSK